MNRSARRGWTLLGPVTALALAIGCGEGTARQPAVAAAPAVHVRFVHPSPEQIVEPIPGTGTIEADKTSDIGPRVDGIIEEIVVQEGDRVEAGAPLFRTRDVECRTRLEESEHALALARAEARKTGHDRARAEELFASHVMSIEQLETVRTADEAARARLGQALTARERARQELADTVVRAPYAGAVTRRFVDEGVMLRTMLSSGAAVVQLMKIDVVVAVVRIPEVHLRQIRVGTPVQIRVDGLDQAFDSQVAVLNDRVDAGSRSLEVRVRLANPQLALKPGMFARARLLPEPRLALVLERRAVQGRTPDQYVFVSAQGRAARRPVQVRDLDDERLEVLSGLGPEDPVLVSPPNVRLDEGVAVEPEPVRAAG